MGNEERLKFGKLMKEYSEKRPIYESYCDSLSVLLKQLLDYYGIKAQKVEARAKSMSSFAGKLKNPDNKTLLNHPLEKQRDLGGCRVIFYLEDDVRTFGRIIDEEFEVVKNIPHRSVDDYNAEHYVVKLDVRRRDLPENIGFKDLICEIQLTTVLFHGWSETNHDIIYKDEALLKKRFPKDMDYLEKQLRKTMREYIQKASYNFSWIVNQHNKLKKGKIILNTDSIKECASQEKNEVILRYLTDLEQFVGNYELPKDFEFLSLFDNIFERASKNVTDRKDTIPVKNIIEKSIDFFEKMAYWDYSNMIDYCVKHILNNTVSQDLIKILIKISHYNLFVAEKIGYKPQLKLIGELSKLVKKTQELDNTILEICKSLLSTTLEGDSSETLDTYTIRRGAIYFNEDLIKIRKETILLLFSLIDKKNDRKYNEELLDTILRSTICHHNIVRKEDQEGLDQDKKSILSTIKKDINSYPDYLKRIVEKDFRYPNLREFVDLRTLLSEIITKLESDTNYQKLRAFVGYETDYGSDWQTKKQRREELLKKYSLEVTDKNVNDWITYLSELTQLYGEDRGILHNINYFLNELGKTIPDMGDKFLGVSDLKHYQVSLMDGLLRSENKEQYQSKIDEYISKGEMLPEIAGTFRFIIDYEDKTFNKLVKIIIEKGDIESLLILLDTVCKNYKLKKSTKEHFLNIIEKLTELKYYEWAHRVSYICEDVVNDLSIEEYSIVLKNLVLKDHISYDSETMLLPLVDKSPKTIIKFFYDRISSRESGKDLIDAIPHSLHRLAEPLSKKIDVIVPEILTWFDTDDWKYNWEGGHFLNIIFKTIDGKFKDIIISEIRTKQKKQLNKIIWILNKYEGTPDILTIVREIILNYKMDSKLRKDLFAILSSMGVVMGEFGISDSYQKKIDEINPWITDENKDVVKFAQAYITYLENNIKYEKARVEKERDLREIEFERTKPKTD